MVKFLLLDLSVHALIKWCYRHGNSALLYLRVEQAWDEYFQKYSNTNMNTFHFHEYKYEYEYISFKSI